MTVKDLLRQNMQSSRDILLAYISDLSDADLLVRSVPQANHIAWQLGHLVVSERGMISSLGQRMQELPAGFEQAHTKETSKATDTSRFARKQQYVELLEQVRQATLSALQATPEADFDKPGPEQMRSYAPTVGSVFALLATHELMHAGQFVPVRRKLGKPVLF